MQRCRVADLQLATDTDGELKGARVRRSLVGPSAGRGRPSIDSDSAGLVAPGGTASFPSSGMDTVVKQRSPNARKWHSTWTRLGDGSPLDTDGELKGSGFRRSLSGPGQPLHRFRLRWWPPGRPWLGGIPPSSWLPDRGHAAPRTPPNPLMWAISGR